MSRKRGTLMEGQEITPGRTETISPIIPIKIETVDPDLISTCFDSEQNTLLEKYQNMNADNGSSGSEEILKQQPQESLGLPVPVELEKRNNLVIRPQKSRRYERERDVPAGVVLDSFKRVILNLDESSRGSPTNRTDDTVRPALLLGSILKVLSNDSQKNTPLFTGLNDGESTDGTVIDEIDGDYDSMIKIEESDSFHISSEKNDEPDAYCGSQSQPETETPYPQIVPSSGDLDFITHEDSDKFETTSNGLPPGVLIKVEPEDPLGFSFPTDQSSTSFSSGEPADSNQVPKSRPNLKTYSHKKRQSKTIYTSSHVNGAGNVLSHDRFEEDQRKCLVCDSTFLSGDALATHLYGHIPLEIWQSKALGFGVLPFSIPQNHESDEDMEETSDSIPVDPLLLVSVKSEVNEMHIQTQNINDNSVTAFNGSTSPDRRTEFEKRYPSLSKRTLNLKNSSNKSRISKKLKTAEGPNLNLNSKECSPPQTSGLSGPKPISSGQKGVKLKSEVTTVQKTRPKMFKPQRRDGSNCPFGFGDVVQKLVEKGKILKPIQ